MLKTLPLTTHNNWHKFFNILPGVYWTECCTVVVSVWNTTILMMCQSNAYDPVASNDTSNKPFQCHIIYSRHFPFIIEYLNLNSKKNRHFNRVSQCIMFKCNETTAIMKIHKGLFIQCFQAYCKPIRSLVYVNQPSWMRWS